MDTAEEIDESMADLVNAYRSVAGKDVAKIALGIGTSRQRSEEEAKRSEFAENASKLLKRLTDHVNEVMFKRQTEFADSSDMLFALAEANRASQSSNCVGLESSLSRFVDLAKRKNEENRKKGVGCAIDDELVLSAEDVVKRRQRERWVPING